MENMNTKKISIKDACGMLDVKPITIQRLIRNGKIISSNKTNEHMISLPSIYNYIEIMGECY